MEKPNVTIYTDGACSGNPGPGGWGVILIYEGHEKTLSGNAKHTTNNQMEMTAAIEALEALKQPCTVTLYTDSTYLKNGITKWIHGWRKNGWKTSKGDPVKNQDLWLKLDKAMQTHDVKWAWVRGHAGDEYNERVDKLAVSERDKHRKKKRSS